MNKVTTRAASDIGGTFTDLVYFVSNPETGLIENIQTEKAHTTPPSFERGVLNSVKKANLSLSDVEFFAHGTTVVINALTERKGVKTGLITTEGFRDILEIGRGNRPDFFNLRYQKPESFVPRYLRREIKERLNYKGEIIAPLELAILDNIIADFKREDVQAVAISLLHAYANPDHEKQVMDYIKKAWPDVAAVASHMISREWREYERTNTAALCAYVQPATEKYLGELEQALAADGFSGSFYVMQSNGGIDTVAATKKTPITIVESGPASGVLGAAALGELLGIDNIIAFDIGGTTAKCSLITGGQVSITNQYMIEKDGKSAGYPIMTPVVDIVEIGNGGGSIGWIDGFGKLHVGPQSAGALPGPVAYGKGGTAPTTTDANLMLGRINPDYFVGGEIQADMSAVRKAMKTLGSGIGLDAQDTARGIIRIANHNMINALKLVSINRGHDPRDFTMVAFGGGGAMHATALAADLKIPKVIIPAHSAVFSAWGMLMSDLRRDYIRTSPGRLDADIADKLNSVFREMEDEAGKAYADEGVSKARLRYERYITLRYSGQEHSVQIQVSDQIITHDGIADLTERFKIAYEKEYTYRLENPVELVGFNLVAFAKIERPELSHLDKNDDAGQALKGRRKVDFDEQGILDADIYDRDKLGYGAQFDGPAIIEEPGSTTVVFPEQSVDVDAFGNLHITT